MLAHVHRHWFLLTLVAVLMAGLAWPDATDPLVRWLPGDVVVGTVMFVMALPLETSALWSAARRPGPAWLAIALNSGVAPPLGWLLSHLLPADLAIGVLIATIVPCTLATAAVWTRRAGGNDAVAFLVTIVTNLSCFAVVPAWLWLLLRPASHANLQHANIDYREIVVGLIVLVVVPILVAQSLRQVRAVAAWAGRRKHGLSLLAQCGVLLIVLFGAVKSGLQLQALDGKLLVSPGNLALMLLAVVTVHSALLVLGLWLSHALRFARADAIAVAFSGSQKTLMVGAYLALAVGPLAILPMVAYHAAQLIIDTLVADWLKGGTTISPAAVDAAELP
jgi:sodium/bile acid cotransporter 7